MKLRRLLFWLGSLDLVLLLGYLKFQWTLMRELDEPSIFAWLFLNGPGPDRSLGLYGWTQYGTGWQHIGGPYSLLWWAVNLLLGGFGLWSFRYGWFAVDCVVSLLLAKQKPFLLMPYTITSYIFFVAWPQNLLILWLLVLAFYNKWFLLVAPLAKLPMGAPLWVWTFIFTSPTSIHDSNNWAQYAILALWWVIPTGLLLLRRRKNTPFRSWSIARKESLDSKTENADSNLPQEGEGHIQPAGEGSGCSARLPCF